MKAFFNGMDLVIAESEEEAGGIIGDLYDGEEWTVWDEDRRQKLVFRRAKDEVKEYWLPRAEEDGITVEVVYGSDIEVECTISEWIKFHGKGYLVTWRGH